MSLLIHRTPSVGSTVKKICSINPDLTTGQIIEIIKQCTDRQGGLASEFAGAEVIDEEKALRLAQSTLGPSHGRVQELEKPSVL